MGSCLGKGMMTITLLYYSSFIINNLVGLYNSVYDSIYYITTYLYFMCNFILHLIYIF